MTKDITDADILTPNAGDDRHTQVDSTTQPFPFWRLVILRCAIILYVASNGMFYSTEEQYVYQRLKDDSLLTNTSLLNYTKISATGCPTPNATKTANEDEIQKDASTIELYFSLTSDGIAAVSVLAWGLLSDVFGRKLLLIVPLVGKLLQSLTVLLVMVLKLDVHFLVIAHTIEGITGAMYCFFLGSTKKYDIDRTS